MGFCTEEEHEIFLQQAPQFERLLVHEGIALTKFWFSVTPGEQHTRFAMRQIDPVRQWKLSPTDIALLDKRDEYTAAKVTMFQRTDTADAPWTVIKSNDKKRARLEAMRSLLAGIDYDRKDPDVVGEPDPLIVGAPADMQELEPGQPWSPRRSGRRGSPSATEERWRPRGRPAIAGRDCPCRWRRPYPAGMHTL